MYLMRWWWIAQAIFAETKIYMPCKSEISLVIKVYEYILLRNKMAQIFPRKFTHRNTKNNIRSANIQFSAAIVGSDAYMYICVSWPEFCAHAKVPLSTVCASSFGAVMSSHIYIYIYRCARWCSAAMTVHTLSWWCGKRKKARQTLWSHP